MHGQNPAISGLNVVVGLARLHEEKRRSVEVLKMLNKALLIDKVWAELLDHHRRRERTRDKIGMLPNESTSVFCLH
jgi:hypothetical protein